MSEVLSELLSEFDGVGAEYMLSVTNYAGGRHIGFSVHRSGEAVVNSKRVPGEELHWSRVAVLAARTECVREARDKARAAGWFDKQKGAV